MNGNRILFYYERCSAPLKGFSFCICKMRPCVKLKFNFYRQCILEKKIIYKLEVILGFAINHRMVQVVREVKDPVLSSFHG